MTMTLPATAIRFYRNLFRKSFSHMNLLRDPDPRIGQRVGDVGDQVPEQREHGADEEDPHDHRIVPRHDRHVEELPHAGNGEDRLEDDASPDQPGNRQAEDGDHRKQGIPQGVLVDDDPLGKTLGPGRQ